MKCKKNVSWIMAAFFHPYIWVVSLAFFAFRLFLFVGNASVRVYVCLEAKETFFHEMSDSFVVLSHYPMPGHTANATKSTWNNKMERKVEILFQCFLFFRILFCWLLLNPLQVHFFDFFFKLHGSYKLYTVINKSGGTYIIRSNCDERRCVNTSKYHTHIL